MCNFTVSHIHAHITHYFAAWKSTVIRRRRVRSIKPYEDCRGYGGGGGAETEPRRWRDDRGDGGGPESGGGAAAAAVVRVAATRMVSRRRRRPVFESVSGVFGPRARDRRLSRGGFDTAGAAMPIRRPAPSYRNPAPSPTPRPAGLVRFGSRAERYRPDGRRRVTCDVLRNFTSSFVCETRSDGLAGRSQPAFSSSPIASRSRSAPTGCRVHRVFQIESSNATALVSFVTFGLCFFIFNKPYNTAVEYDLT